MGRFGQFISLWAFASVERSNKGKGLVDNITNGGDDKEEGEDEEEEEYFSMTIQPCAHGIRPRHGAEEFRVIWRFISEAVKLLLQYVHSVCL